MTVSAQMSGSQRTVTARTAKKRSLDVARVHRSRHQTLIASMVGSKSYTMTSLRQRRHPVDTSANSVASSPPSSTTIEASA